MPGRGALVRPGHRRILVDPAHAQDPELIPTVTQDDAIIAAAARFQRAWDAAMAGDGEGLIVSDLDIVEVHEAALELIGATGTHSLHEALEALHQTDP
ncbi:MAG TPA: hypothetical protein VN796_11265 [Acidimicrobiales bacterium]|nr:hypothetical protein [Acidimicrobiales bacterium]